MLKLKAGASDRADHVTFISLSGQSSAVALKQFLLSVFGVKFWGYVGLSIEPPRTVSLLPRQMDNLKDFRLWQVNLSELNIRIFSIAWRPHSQSLGVALTFHSLEDAQDKVATYISRVFQ